MDLHLGQFRAAQLPELGIVEDDTRRAVSRDPRQFGRAQAPVGRDKNGADAGARKLELEGLGAALGEQQNPVAALHAILHLQAEGQRIDAPVQLGVSPGDRFGIVDQRLVMGTVGGVMPDPVVINGNVFHRCVPCHGQGVCADTTPA